MGYWALAKRTRDEAHRGGGNGGDGQLGSSVGVSECELVGEAE